jgi:hypothetical protein
MKPHHLVKAVLFTLLFLLTVMVGGTYFFYSSTNKARAVSSVYEENGELNKALEKDYENCIVLGKEEVIRITGQQKMVLAYPQIEAVLRSDTASFHTAELKIIVTPDTDYQKISDILFLMSKLAIKKYKLLKV